jgi:hypothetical protein
MTVRVATVLSAREWEPMLVARDVLATIPGTADLQVLLEADGAMVHGSLSFDWQPPGPDLLPVTISVERRAPIVVPP